MLGCEKNISTFFCGSIIKLKNNTGIPDFELEALARMLLPKIQEMFKDEKVQEEFEVWKAERVKKQEKKKLD